MPARPVSKYHLKDLHEEIGLYDRKITHCQNIQKFDSEEERTREVGRLAKKRQLLVKSAAEMAGSGIECDPNHVPASLKNAS